jgi:hypothetical protein
VQPETAELVSYEEWKMLRQEHSPGIPLIDSDAVSMWVHHGRGIGQPIRLAMNTLMLNRGG